MIVDVSLSLSYQSVQEKHLFFVDLLLVKVCIIIIHHADLKEKLIF